MDERNFKKTVQSTFDKASFGYDLPEIRFFDSSAEYMVGLMGLLGTENVLDVCTGTGHVVHHLLPRLCGGRVTGLDISEGMLAVAREKFKDQVGCVEFVRSDLEEYNPGGLFGRVSCAFGIFFFPDMERALKNMRSLVAPGGKTVLSSFEPPFMEPQRFLLGQRLQKYNVNVPPQKWMNIDNEEKMRDFLSGAGSGDIEIYKKDCSYNLQNADLWWNIIMNTNMRSTIELLPEEALLQFKKEHLEEVAALDKGCGIPLAVHVLYAVLSNAD